MRLLAATLVLALTFTELAVAAWHPPVPGAVARPFDLGSDPFEAGRHRGIDLAAAPGTTVRAPCTGPVAFSGAVGSSGRVVTVLCGRWRVTHMPLASIAVRRGATVQEGAPLGTLARSPEHAGLHLGVRREGTSFGYTDPLRFLATGSPTAPPLGPPPRTTRPPRPTLPRPPAPRPPAPRPASAPHPITAPPRALVPPRPVAGPLAIPGSNPKYRPPFAPWPAWVGLALMLAGAGVRIGARSRRAHEPHAAAVRQLRTSSLPAGRPR